MIELDIRMNIEGRSSPYNTPKKERTLLEHNTLSLSKFPFFDHAEKYC